MIPFWVGSGRVGLGGDERERCPRSGRRRWRRRRRRLRSGWLIRWVLSLVSQRLLAVRQLTGIDGFGPWGRFS
jgi:hypothetical protein